jgi:hypothetical protein
VLNRRASLVARAISPTAPGPDRPPLEQIWVGLISEYELAGGWLNSGASHGRAFLWPGCNVPHRQSPEPSLRSTFEDRRAWLALGLVPVAERCLRRPRGGSGLTTVNRYIDSMGVNP